MTAHFLTPRLPPFVIPPTFVIPAKAGIQSPSTYATLSLNPTPSNPTTAHSRHSGEGRNPVPLYLRHPVL